MSFKAYGGLVLSPSNLEQLTRAAQQVFLRLDDLSHAHEAAFVARSACDRHDRAWYALHQGQEGAEPLKPIHQYISHSADEMRKRQADIKATMRRDPVVDSEVSFAVWLGPDARFYAHTNTEVRGVLSLLIETGFARDFSFWNNSDRPDDVTEAEWEYRRYVWEELSSHKCGSAFHFNSTRYAGFPELDLIESKWPDLRTRAEALLENEYFGAWLKANPKYSLEGDGVGRCLHAYSQAIADDTDGWGSRFDQSVSSLVALLPPLSTVFNERFEHASSEV